LFEVLFEDTDFLIKAVHVNQGKQGLQVDGTVKNYHSNGINLEIASNLGTGKTTCGIKILKPIENSGTAKNYCWCQS
jgi:hypothetical protein